MPRTTILRLATCLLFKSQLGNTKRHVPAEALLPGGADLFESIAGEILAAMILGGHLGHLLDEQLGSSRAAVDTKQLASTITCLCHS